MTISIDNDKETNNKITNKKETKKNIKKTLNKKTMKNKQSQLGGKDKEVKDKDKEVKDKEVKDKEVKDKEVKDKKEKKNKKEKKKNEDEFIEQEDAVKIPPLYSPMSDNDKKMFISCIHINYGDDEYLLDEKTNNIYTIPNLINYYLIGKKVGNAIQFDEDYLKLKKIIDTKNN
jgi:hypothetical protein